MDRETIARVAKVARLNLTEGEMERYAKDLDDILNSFSVLDEAPAGDSYSFNPIPVVDVLREDEPAQDLDPQVLRNQMSTYQDYVRGPRLS
ncbi:Aspartyl/glutamyl-tRNA(Asn/Gln) amidotransferase subunit C [anaerobic digester metagenome]|jgi:aspartyl-tRNA(Asn)/glutamyl-tRNA(Gln) amidotransferase subunit C|nr:Asp-tRNA(Asn)/Glu-tRNA(Gln) amidotransferase subunit GatC [Methanomassiliicoccales archaeon]